MLAQFKKAEAKGMVIPALASYQPLNIVDGFWLNALMALQNNSTFTEILAFATLHDLNKDEIEELLYYLGVLYRENQLQISTITKR